jgi:CHAT domain-containing protein
MGRTPGRRDLLLPLPIVLFLSLSAAAQTLSQRAAAEVRSAADRGLWLMAEAKASEALRRLGSSDDDSIWEIRVRRGEALLYLTRSDEARQALEPELPKRLAHSALAVRRLTAIAYLAKDPDAAKRYLAEVLQLAKSHQPSTLPEVMFLQAAIDRKNAKSILPRALQLARKNGDKRMELRIAQVINHTRIMERHYVEAIRGNEKLIQPAHELPYEGMEQKLEGDLGWALMEIGDFDEAAEHVARAERISASTGAILDRIPWLVQLGNIAYLRRDLAAAERYYRQALVLGEPLQHEQLGFVNANLATLALETGRYDEARRLNAAAMALKKQANMADSLLRSRIIDARIATAAGDYAAARKAVETVAAESNKPETRWLAEAQLAIVYAAEKRDAEADKQFRRAMTTMRNARASITDEMLRLSFNNPRDFIDDYLDFLIAAGRKEDALLTKEEVQGQTLEEGLAVTANIDPQTIARQTGASILYYHLGSQHSYVWSITPEAIRVATLPPRATIRAAVDAYVRDLVGPMGSSESRGLALYRMLVEPSSIRGGPVIVIADERLNVLNLEALVVPGPKPHYWIEDVVLRSAPSLQILGRAIEPRKRSDSVLLIGNAPQADAAYPALPRAGVEVSRVRKRFARAVVLDGAKATPTAYRQASPETFDVVHFVAHGEATMTKPLDSAVILARDRSGYKLFAHDIVQQPITARLVTISSCYGAGKRTYVGEGLVGLAWAFLHAGAQQVIAAVWDVSDVATPDLMDAMYEGIHKGQDPPNALRAAKLKLVHGKGAHTQPRFWAPFVIYSGM